MVPWVFGIHRRCADLGAIKLVTATNVPRCWVVSPPVPPGLTLVGMRCSHSLVPQKIGAFPMSSSTRIKGLLSAWPRAIPLINPLQMVSSLQLSFPMGAVMICNTWIGFSRGTLGISMVMWWQCCPVHEGIGIRCSSRTTVVNKLWVKKDLHDTVRELLRAVRVCSVIQLQKCANVLDKRF